jgi:hypothetical protein
VTLDAGTRAWIVASERDNQRLHKQSSDAAKPLALNLQSFLIACKLSDLHYLGPAPSTLVAAPTVQTNCTFGYLQIRDHAMTSGVLSYSNGSQLDHHGLVYVDSNLESFSKARRFSFLLSPPAVTELLTGMAPSLSDWHDNDGIFREFPASFTSIPPSVIDQGDIPTDISEHVICRGFKTRSELTAILPSVRHLSRPL